MENIKKVIEETLNKFNAEYGDKYKNLNFLSEIISEKTLTKKVKSFIYENLKGRDITNSVKLYNFLIENNLSHTYEDIAEFLFLKEEIEILSEGPRFMGMSEDENSFFMGDRDTGRTYEDEINPYAETEPESDNPEDYNEATFPTIVVYKTLEGDIHKKTLESPEDLKSLPTNLDDLKHFEPSEEDEAKNMFLTMGGKLDNLTEI